MFCNDCGTELVPKSKYCFSCGKPSDQSVASGVEKKSALIKYRSTLILTAISIAIIFFLYIQEKHSKEIEKAAANTSLDTANQVPPAWLLPDTSKKVVEQNIIPARTKFLVVEIITNEPEVNTIVIDHTSSPGQLGSGIGVPADLEPVKTVSNRKLAYYSEVVEVDNYSEESEYKLIDQFESSIVTQLQRTRVSFSNDPEAKFTIISRKPFLFDSYAEASRYRSRVTSVKN